MNKQPQILNNRHQLVPVKTISNSVQTIQAKETLDPDDFTEKLQDFLNLLNQSPDPQQVKVNQYANNSRYLPIEYLESQLDLLFGGLWQLKHVGGVSFVGNSITANVELCVFHPIAKIWLSRAGSGAVQIQLDQNGYAKPKSVEKATGAALAMAEKNAIKKLGGVFGKYLNRGGDEVAEYYAYMYGSKIINQ